MINIPKISNLIFSFLGDEVAKYSAVPITNSVIVASWKIDKEAAGGDYKISITAEESTSDMIYAKAERNFEVREFFGN